LVKFTAKYWYQWNTSNTCSLFVIATEFLEAKPEYKVQCWAPVCTTKIPDLEKLWPLEMISITDQLGTKSDDQTLKTFNESVRFEKS